GEEPGQEADEASGRAGERDADDRHCQRDPRSVQQTTQGIAPVPVGAEDVAGLGALEADRRGQALAQRPLQRRVRRQEWREERAQQQQRDDRQRHNRRPAPVARAPGEEFRVGDDGGAVAHREYLIFGFKYAYRTSTSKFTLMYMADRNSTTVCTMG